MSVITEKRSVVGRLVAQGYEFELLEDVPTRHNQLHFLVRENAFEFQVVVDGFAQGVTISRGNFMIIPYLEPKEIDVKFLIADEEDDKQLVPQVSE